MSVNCACGNFARYVNERSELCCALCPLKQGIASWRILDVPEIIATLQAKLMDTHEQLISATVARNRALFEVEAWRNLEIALTDMKAP